MEKEYQKSPEDDQHLFEINHDYLSREIAGERILIPTGEQTMHTADMGIPNETFQFLWEQFQTPNTFRDVIAAARGLYSDDSGEMERDILSFINECLRAGLLREVKS